MFEEEEKIYSATYTGYYTSLHTITSTEGLFPGADSGEFSAVPRRITEIKITNSKTPISYLLDLVQSTASWGSSGL